ncbi:MAG: DUF2461 domain-containing protein [Bryobacterales bacterium]|nr:DUF2461 domain-containing protein [Bryobacterales bacterium]
MIPPSGLRFLAQLKRNNNREWFQEHKQEFDEYLRSPMEALVGELNATLAQAAPDYVTEPGKAIFRIYRDTRFSADKTPYKTHLGALFPKRGMAKLAGGSLYFHVSASEALVAGGVYAAEPKTLLALRTFIAGHHQELHSILNARAAKTLCGPLHGTTLQRPPKGFAATHPAIEFIKRKQWYYDVTLDAKEASRPGFARLIGKHFLAMLPLVEFLNRGIPKPPRIREDALR